MRARSQLIDSTGLMKMVVMARRRSKVDEHVKKSDQIEKDDDIGREEGRL